MEHSTDDQDLLEALGKDLRSRREELKLTKEEVAGLAGITPTYLHKLELGRQAPTIRVLCGLAVALHQPLIELLRQTSARVDANQLGRKWTLDTDERKFPQPRKL